MDKFAWYASNKEHWATRRAVRLEWYQKNVMDKVAMTMRERLSIAAEYIHQKVVQNISIPVVAIKTKSGRRKVIERSKKGEYPRADFGHLIRTLFHGVHKADDGEWEGYVGTPLEYGAILEYSKRLDRTYLQRTLDENKEMVGQMLSGPLKN